MKGRIVAVTIVLVMSISAITANVRWSEAQQGTMPAGESRQAADQAPPVMPGAEETPVPGGDFNSGPVMFVENAGQWDDRARFQVWGGPAGTMWLAEDAIWTTVLEPEETSRQADINTDPRLSPGNPVTPSPERGVNIKLSFVGANAQPQIETFERLDTTVSYFLGSAPEKWRPEVPVWGGVRYVDLYPGVALEIVGENGQPVYRLVTQPGADLGAVRLRVEGADAVAVDGATLRIVTAAGDFALPLLQAPGATRAVAVQASGDQAFEIVAPFASADASPQSPSAAPQVPADNTADLLYGTFVGGSGYEYGYGIAVNGAGNVFVAGVTASSNFPTTPGAFDPSYSGAQDAFVVKLNSAGSGLAYATFLGGVGIDGAYALVLDGTSSAYVTGYTGSSDFPVTTSAFDRTYNGGDDVFVAKLNPAGNGLAYATFLGGSGGDTGYGIIVDETGSAYTTGWTNSPSFPTTSGAYDRTYNGDRDVFVTRLNAAGSGLVFSTYLGGLYYDSGHALALRGSDLYVVGGAGAGFPTTAVAFDTSPNGCSTASPWCDAFVAKLSSDASRLVFSTYLGGNLGEWANGIAVDSSGNAVVVGPTSSSNFPVVTGAFDGSHNGSQDVFVTKIAAAGNALLFSTFVGGNDVEYGNFVAIDGSNHMTVAGGTSSGNFPTTPNGYDRSLSGAQDAYLFRLRADGRALLYSTYLGGAGDDWGTRGSPLDLSGRTRLTGYTYSNSFPTTAGAFDRSFNGAGDAFVAKLAMGPPLPFDAAELASQSEYLTVAPGAAISPWIVVRNTGTTTWTPAEYGYNGKGALQGMTGYITRNVAPGDTYRFFWNLNAPTTPGVYDYGFMLRHGTQEFGPYFFVRVTVIGYTISGRVVDTNGAGISGVTVRADSSHTATTDSAGNYTLSGLLAGTYTVQPSKNGYAFCPGNRRVNLASNVADQNFTGFGATVTLGFCPNLDGYKFCNGPSNETCDEGWGYYPTSANDFRQEDLIRMFGQDAACVMIGSTCQLRTTAQKWLEEANSDMNGGHCDGMATTSLRFFKGDDQSSTFNSEASTAHDLDLGDVRHHIAYYYVEQLTDPVRAYKQQVRQNTPSAILNQLRGAMQGGAPDPTTLFVRKAGEGGHAITPYAIEDKGNGVSWVRVYDNNYPDDLSRYVVVDTVNQTWSYNLGWTTWTGDANTKTLGVVPISQYAEQPVCPWCDGSLQMAEPDNPLMQEVWFDGPGHLLITDTQGRRLGYSGAQFVSEISGAYGGFVDGGLGVEQEPIYKLPVSGGYTILVDGQTAGQPENATISQFGPGYAAQVENVRLQPSVRDSITIGADGRQITYQPNSSRNPTLSLALDDAAASYELGVVGAEIAAGQRVTVAAQEATGRLMYSNAQAGGGDYGLFVRRVSSSGVQLFAHSALTVAGGDTHYADYRSWDGQGPMTLLIDHASNGTIDETVTLENQIRSVYLPKVVGN